MEIKIVILSSLLISATYGFSFHIFDDPEAISPHVVCTGVADGSKLPHETDCGKFYLCDGGASLQLSCRTSAPYFDRCTGICETDISVCTIKDCPGSTIATTQPSTAATTQPSTAATTQPSTAATTQPSTAATTQPSTAATTQPSTAATTQPSTAASTQPSTVTESTTKFIPPTVPTACPIPCLPADAGAADCDCVEQWICVNEKCVCDATIECPMTAVVCALEENCGCEDRCDCSAGADICFCKTDGTQCPFDDTDGACIKKCGCQKNCACTGTAVGCTCNPTCTCIEPPKVCPFKPADCVANCGCEKRCLCNGDFCTCDGDNACPASFWKRH